MPHAANPQTVITAPESTENIPSARRVRDVARRIAYLDPDAAPLLQILSRGRSRVATNTKPEWIEKDLPASWAMINNGAGYASGITADIKVDNGAGAGVARYFSVNDIVNVVRTGEKMKVTAVDLTNNEIDVVRSVGTTAAAALVDNDDLQIIGTAYAEGSTSGAPKSHVETYPFNYLQIVKTPFSTTNSEAASENYTGPDRPRLRAEKAIEHKLLLERSALYGERDIDSSDPNGPIRYTGGLLFFLTENIKDFGGTTTESEMELWTEDLFHHTGSGDSRLLLAAPRVISVMNSLAAGRIQTVSRDKAYGLHVVQWITGHGEFNIVKHRLLENGIGGTGYGNYAIALDPSKLMFRFLTGRNTKLETDIQANDADAWKDQYITEAGWQVENPRFHGIAKNITG
jgi:hypothetical protein